MSIDLDLADLRSLVAVADLGGVTAAAERLARSTSAVSAQIKKLEGLTGATLLRRQGRGVVLTEAGETLASFGRRMLDLNDAAVARLRPAPAAAPIRIGLQEDCGELLLTGALRRFSRLHPGVRVEVTIGRNAMLQAEVARGALDFVVVWDDGAAKPFARALARLPMIWIEARDGASASMDEAAPLLVLEEPCRFRAAATVALDRAGRPWRLALTSPSLAGVTAGAAAGLGLAVRTELSLSPALRVADAGRWALPPLPSIDLILQASTSELSPFAADLAASFEAEIADEKGRRLWAPPLAAECQMGDRGIP